MNHPAQLVASIIANAASLTSREDAAAAAVSGLRRIRSTLDERVGYAAAHAVDDGIGEFLLAERLRRRAAGEAEHEPVPLPTPAGTRGRRVATALVEDAVDTGIGLTPAAMAAMGAGGMVHVLLARLVDFLGGVPDTDGLLAAVRGTADPEAMPAETHPVRIARLH